MGKIIQKTLVLGPVILKFDSTSESPVWFIKILSATFRVFNSEGWK